MSTSDNNTPEKRFQAQLTGRVQGVGFRHFTRTTARRLDLDGWVRNEPNGSVTVVAEGAEGPLRELLEAVHDGPISASVEEVDVNWEDPTGKFDGFTVKY